ncbi:MAG: hypothetical protein IJ824_00845, partial [Alphaproteobacteria bacterium]|nr:hypothetical protein [Alphaproteobacteria bacterium]
MQNFIIRITQENFKLINDARFSCFILPETADTSFAAKFAVRARENGKLTLCEGKNALENYQQYKTDGLILDTITDPKPEKTVKTAQQKAPQAIIGVISRNRRHEAMLISECEPDFIIFKVWTNGLAHNRELLSWYNELFLIQYAAQPEENTDWSSLPAD